ncbi:guanine nucleotide-binding protein subunit gamma 2-like protein [Carex littledalei]|uniref:Guanine nucleotide-binding protein subunit gamma 2-like protein n=1 Tax=Carex littledalei TaxID=544730 RepID=A0A833VJD1_9POAL|nr:guanine nucleotide-binding protein subunit gamma 2-like protein [Carex littledalei]
MEANGEEETSSVDGGSVGWDPQSDTRGKHRISVELKRLEQEAQFLEEELQEIEKTEKASAEFEELIYKIESKPDPLLPITIGPVSPMWDQWFERPKQMHRCRCWII